MSSFISDIVMVGICKKGAFVTVPAENSTLVYSQGFLAWWLTFDQAGLSS